MLVDTHPQGGRGAFDLRPYGGVTRPYLAAELRAAALMMKATIFDLIDRRTKTAPRSTFLGSTDGRTASSFADLAEITTAVGRLLRDMNVRPSDRVVAVTPNGPEAASVFLSVSAFAACAPLNPGYSADQFEFYIEDLAPSAILVSSDHGSAVGSVAASRNIPVIEIHRTDKAGVFDFSGRDQLTGPVPQAGGHDDIALLLHTSGTTARPKLVPIPHSNLVRSAKNIAGLLQLSPDDRALNIMPLFHIHGLVGVLLSTLSAGAGVVCSEVIDSGRFMHWMHEYRPTWYSGVPTMHSAILAGIPADGSSLNTTLRFIRSSSAALPVSTLQALEDRFGVPVIEAYGMTEASHQMSSNPLPPGVRKPGSVGLPAGPEISIRRTGGTRAEAGETGEVWIKGETVIDAYAGGRGEESFVNGWFRTGDLGRFDADGYLFLVGRIKEMINRGGEKVAPAAVEAALLEHRQVAEAAVFAVPHPTLGEDVAAAVVAEAGLGKSLRPGDLRAYALERLSDAEVPGQILIVPAIPKGPTGKVQRSKLHEQLADRFEASSEPPAGRIARILAQIWREAISDDIKPGADSNFFGLGGDSLTGARVAARVSYVFQIEFDIRDLFTDPSLQGMADRIERALIASAAE